jgi:hypothetical protein
VPITTGFISSLLITSAVWSATCFSVFFARRSGAGALCAEARRPASASGRRALRSEVGHKGAQTGDLRDEGGKARLRLRIQVSMTSNISDVAFTASSID